MCFWRTTDTRIKDRGPLPLHIRRVLETVPPSKVDDIPAINYFFEGIEYVLTDNKAAAAHFVRNNHCIGVAMVLADDEPDDDLSQPYRLLRKPPRAMYVKPAGTDLGDIIGHGVPPGCVPITPKSAKIKIKLPHALELDGQMVDAVDIHRTGLPLGNGYAVTDYFAQGMNFRNDCWLLHLTPPPTGAFDRASLLVMLTRYSSMDDVKLLTPLWPTGNAAARKRVIQSFYKASQMDVDLVHELARLKHASAQTRAKNQHRLLAYQ